MVVVVVACCLPLLPNFTDPFPFFTSTIQVAVFPLGPLRILKENIPFIFFTYRGPSFITKQRIQKCVRYEPSAWCEQ